MADDFDQSTSTLRSQILGEKQKYQVLLDSIKTAKDECFSLLTRDVPREAVDQMQESAQRAVEYVDDPNPRIRSAALFFLGQREDVNRDAFTEILSRCATSDEDSRVREQAISCLGTIHRQRQNTFVGSLLASIVSQESEPVKLRVAAYSSLHEMMMEPVEGSKVDDMENCILLQWLKGEFVFPDDVDMKVIERFVGK